MKRLSETAALEKLRKLKADFRDRIRDEYEQEAEPCASCTTPGACCLDAHFVNVRISRLEATAIRRAIDDLPVGKRHEVEQKINDAITSFGLDDDGDSQKTFACPLYERQAGCLVHDGGKPLPCIHHACYERKEDLPPDEILDEAEITVERLNRRVYGRQLPLLPLPVAIRNASRSV
jgi:hypothetical protein